MITIFNREELLVTTDMSRQSQARDLLSAGGVRYLVKTTNLQEHSWRHSGSFGRVPEPLYEYRIYVNKEDVRKAARLLAAQGIPVNGPAAGNGRTSRKTRRIIIIAAAVTALLLISFGVFRMTFRKITVVSGKELVDECPSFARPGQEVVITTAVVEDGEIYVNGAGGAYVRPGVYVFVMPDEDVRIRIHVTANPDGS